MVPVTTYHGLPCGKCTGTLRWRACRNCVECHRANKRERYANLDHVAYYSKLLRDRRHKALKRRAERHAVTA